MKKIIVPTDFSTNAYAALFYASKLFSEEPLHITLLHSFGNEISTLTSRVDVGRSDNMVEKLERHANEDGQQLLHKIKLDAANLPHTYEVIITPAPLARTINKMVAQDGYTLVVVGTKGRTGAEGVLMGSTTINLVKALVGCPLLIVPREVDFVVPSNIVFASDYKDFFQLSKLRPIIRLVRQYNSTLHLLHVGKEKELEDQQRQNLEKYQNDLSEYDTQFHFIAKNENISKSIHNFMDKRGMELLCLVYHKHTFIKQLFREPVVSRVGKHAHIPTLVIPIKQ